MADTQQPRPSMAEQGLAPPTTPATRPVSSPWDWFLLALSKTFEFSGRSRRKEWGWHAVIGTAIQVLTANLGGLFAVLISGGVGFLYMSIAFTISSLFTISFLAAGTRRLHDTGRSGWWLLLVVAPLVGAVVLLILFLQDTERGTNKWGPNHKYPYVPND